MPAPARAVPDALPSSDAVTLTVPEGQAAPAGYTVYRGALPEEHAGAPVFLVCGGAAYEAFTGGDGTFQACLPEGSAPTHVAASNGTTMTVFPAVQS